MKVKEIVEILNLKVFCGELNLDKDISGGYVSDLLSDVMGNAESGDLWITLQTHKNVMAVASLKDLAAIIVVKGLEPENDMVEQGISEGIPVLGTNLETFEIAGKLYGLLGK